MRFAVSVLSLYYIPGSVVCLPTVKRWLSAASPELWVRREQGCKLLAINREQGGILLEQTKPRHQPISASLILGPPFLKKIDSANQILIYSREGTHLYVH